MSTNILVPAGTPGGRAEMHAYVTASGLQAGSILKVSVQGVDRTTGKTNSLIDDTLNGI